MLCSRDGAPQSHLLADELPKLFQRECHLLGLIELLRDARGAQGAAENAESLAALRYPAVKK
jgi:hypothetical protein